MKRIVVSLYFIISMIMSVGLLAQEKGSVVQNSSENSIPSQNKDSMKVEQKWTNDYQQFVGIWSLERTIVDSEGKEKIVHPGTFMVVNPNSSYTIFVYTDLGAVITSQGNIIVESTDNYIEVISQHMNSSLIGVSNRIEYKINAYTLNKSFWIEKDKQGGDYKRQVNETWKRACIPVIVTYDDSGAYPI